MSKLYRVISKEYVIKILSEQKITVDFVDLNSVQNLVEFVEFTKPTIQYKADDFLFSLTNENETSFKKNCNIDLSQVEQFGWYYGKIHKSEVQLYRATNPKKFQNLTDMNPEIKIESFDKYRDFYRPIKATNVLNGAFGLAYTVFKDEYDNFFRKIQVHKDNWIIDKSKLIDSDYPILTQVLLYCNVEGHVLNKSILKDGEFVQAKGSRIYSYFLETALNYFLRNDYSMDNFLSKMKGEFEKYPELKVFVDDFKLLNDRYVKKGLLVDTKNPITVATKEFIDLAKTESENLNGLLTQNDLNKTAVFLLGMLNLGDRIDEQFSFDNFVPAIVDLTMRHIVDIKVSEKEVVISFDQKEIDKNRNNKFDYVKNYFKELCTIKEFSDKVNELTNEINELKSKSNLFKQIYESRTEIIELDADVKDLENEIERYGLQKQNLIDRAKEGKWFDKKYKEWINSENEKESLEKITKSLSDEISVFKDDKMDYEKEESDLSKEIASLKAKINSLKQTEKSLKLEKSDLANKGKPPKNTEAKKLGGQSSNEISEPQNAKPTPKIENEKIELKFSEDKSPTISPSDS